MTMILMRRFDSLSRNALSPIHLSFISLPITYFLGSLILILIIALEPLISLSLSFSCLSLLSLYYNWTSNAIITNITTITIISLISLSLIELIIYLLSLLSYLLLGLILLDGAINSTTNDSSFTLLSYNLSSISKEFILVLVDYRFIGSSGVREVSISFHCLCLLHNILVEIALISYCILYLPVLRSRSRSNSSFSFYYLSYSLLIASAMLKENKAFGSLSTATTITTMPLTLINNMLPLHVLLPLNPAVMILSPASSYSLGSEKPLNSPMFSSSSSHSPLTTTNFTSNSSYFYFYNFILFLLWLWVVHGSFFHLSLFYYNIFLVYLILIPLLLTYYLILWLTDILIESNLGLTSCYEIYGLTIGFILFIFSESMIFFTCFWSFFNLLLLSLILPNISINLYFTTIYFTLVNPYATPFANLLILLYSSLPLQSALIYVKTGLSNKVLETLGQNVLCGFTFTILQLREFIFAYYTISDSIFGSIFYSTTGLHGLHVIVGTILLSSLFLPYSLPLPALILIYSFSFSFSLSLYFFTSSLPLSSSIYHTVHRSTLSSLYYLITFIVPPLTYLSLHII